MRRLFGGLLIILILIAPKVGETSREIPDDNLAYPVLISLETGSNGSGFFLNNDSRIYLVTASHVLFEQTSGNLKAQQARLLSYSIDPKETERNIIQLDLKTLVESRRVRKHLSEDVAVVFIAMSKENAETGQRSLSVARPKVNCAI